MTPKENSTKLMNAMIPFAKKMLDEYGEFRPFGGYLMSDGRIVDVGLDLKKHVSASEAVEILKKRFREISKEDKPAAFAIVYMVHIRCPSGTMSDAIQINLDHEKGCSAEVLYPYSIEKNTVVYGTIFAQAGINSIQASGKSQETA